MIELSQIKKQYKNNVVAVENVSCQIMPGRITGLLGPNGAGKTTLLHMILGLVFPTMGTAFIDGRPYSRISDTAQKVGAVLSVDTLDPQLTAVQHLSILCAMSGLDENRVEACLEQTDILYAANRKIKTYSLGMRQRLGISAALLGEPDVLILDEPFNGLDAAGIRWLRSFAKEYAASGRTVIISSHLMGEMQEISEHFLIMSQGRLLADASFEELLAKEKDMPVRIKTPDSEKLIFILNNHGMRVEQLDDGRLYVRGGEAEEIGTLAQENNIALFELFRLRPSLEQIYFTLLEADGKGDVCA